MLGHKQKAAIRGQWQRGERISILDRLKGRDRATAVTITSINLKFMGETHSIGGKKVDSRVFELSIPFQNKIGSDLLPDNLKGPGLSLAKIEVSQPFRLVSSAPGLPLDVDYMSKVVFKLRIEAPEVTYEGPLTINFGNEQKETVNINISRMALMANGSSIELEDSGMAATMQKGQIFKRSVQLYKVLRYRDQVGGIAVSQPFELVSTDPKVPFALDKKDSFIVGLYIKAPSFSYSGALDVTFR